MKETILIILVAVVAYWFGSTHNDQSKTVPSQGTTKATDTVKTPTVTAGEYPEITEPCSTEFNTLKELQPLGEKSQFLFTDFGNLLTSYMKDCHPNLNTTGGIFGAGIDIDLGTVPLQGYNTTEGATSYKLSCIYFGKDSQGDDIVNCQTNSSTRVWDEHDNYGKLNCSVDFTICGFDFDNATNIDKLPAFGKSQRFMSTLDHKHGFSCTPEDPADTQNYNWDCKSF